MNDLTAAAPAMTTDMPPAIRTPDRVESRLGTLTFKDGVPDDATAQKLFDEIDYVHAFEAVVGGGMIRSRHSSLMDRTKRSAWAFALGA